MNLLFRPNRRFGRTTGMPRVAMALLAVLLLAGCAVVSVADAVVGVGAAVVSVAATTVKVGAKVVGAAVDAVTPERGKKD
jgi:hypothetical protein